MPNYQSPVLAYYSYCDRFSLAYKSNSDLVPIMKVDGNAKNIIAKDLCTPDILSIECVCSNSKILSSQLP